MIVTLIMLFLGWVLFCGVIVPLAAIAWQLAKLWWQGGKYD
jgi:hypothetical protein